MLEYVQNWLAGIQRDYGVNPFIFATIYLVSVIPFWFSIFKIITGLRKKRYGTVTTFGILLGIIILAPFVYVAFFGRNLPVWVWVVAAALIGYSAYSVLRRVKKPKNRD